MSVVVCTRCGAKLKVNAAALKVVREIPCGKCQTRIQVTHAMRAEAAAGLETSSAPVESNDSISSPAPAGPDPIRLPSPAEVPQPSGTLSLVRACLTAELDAQRRRLAELEQLLASLPKT